MGWLVVKSRSQNAVCSHSSGELWSEVKRRGLPAHGRWTEAGCLGADLLEKRGLEDADGRG